MADILAQPAPGPGAPGATASATAAVEDLNKVFAGNLAFSTSEDQLKQIFAEVGQVTHVQIIHRGTRSLGYGFVTYATEAEAQKAVATLDKRELAGREINVEGAKPQLMNKHNDSGHHVEGETKEGGRGTGRNARRTRGTRRDGAAASRRPRTDEGEEGLDEITEANGGAKSSRKPKKTNGAAAATPRKPKGPPEGEPSKTLLFVANLPFQFTDEQLQAAFEGFQVSSAKVIKRRFGSRTKGFGFVDLANETEQQRALQEVQGKTVEGRPVSIRVAIQGQDRTADVNEGEAEAAAEASGAPAA